MEMENLSSGALTKLKTLSRIALDYNRERPSRLQSLPYRLKHSFDFDVHTDPLGAGSAMAVSATINVYSFNANVARTQTSVAPPFRRTKQANDWRAGGDGQMGRASVSADIDLRAFGQLVETL